jgi:hypothetical protein
MRDPTDDLRAALLLDRQTRLWLWTGPPDRWPEVRVALELGGGEYVAALGGSSAFQRNALALATVAFPRPAVEGEGASPVDAINPQVASLIWLGVTRLDRLGRIEKSEAWAALLAADGGQA